MTLADRAARLALERYRALPPGLFHQPVPPISARTAMSIWMQQTRLDPGASIWGERKVIGLDRLCNAHLGGPDRVHLTEEAAAGLRERFALHLIGHSQMSGCNPNRRERIAIWFAEVRWRLRGVWAVLTRGVDYYDD